MAKDHDFDEELEDNEEYNLGIQEEDEPDFPEEIEDLKSSQKDIVEPVEDSEKIENEALDLRPPPSAHAGKEMMDTFNDMYTITQELATMVNVTIKEVHKLNTLTDKKNADVVKISGEYQKIHSKIYSTISETQKYFENNLIVVNDLSQIRTEFLKNIETILSEIETTGNNYREIVADSTLSLTKKIDTLANNVDLTGVTQTLEKEINKVIINSNLKKMQNTLEKFDKTYHEIVDALNILSGSGDKKGLFFDLAENIDMLDEKLISMKKSFNWFGYVSIGIFSFIIGGVVSYYSLSTIFIDKLSSELREQNEKIHATYKDRLEASSAYNAWQKEYGVRFSDKYGFGYFSNTNKPYFYYPNSAKSYDMKGKTVVVLGEE